MWSVTIVRGQSGADHVAWGNATRCASRLPAAVEPRFLRYAWSRCRSAFACTTGLSSISRVPCRHTPPVACDCAALDFDQRDAVAGPADEQIDLTLVRAVVQPDRVEQHSLVGQLLA